LWWSETDRRTRPLENKKARIRVQGKGVENLIRRRNA